MPVNARQEAGSFEVNRDYALAYAERGLFAAPLPEGQKKMPPKGWLEDALKCGRDPEAITRWVEAAWANRPDGNLAFVLPVGWIVFDGDVPSQEHGDVNGLALLDAYQRLHGPLPKTWMQLTASGGMHLVFRLPAALAAKKLKQGTKRRGLDIRIGGAGYIVAAPSSTPTGSLWVWIHPDGSHHPLPPEGEPAEMPLSLWDWYQGLDDKPQAEAPAAPPAALPLAPRGDGHPYALKAIENAAQRIANAPDGMGNETINQETYLVAQLAAHLPIDAKDQLARAFAHWTYKQADDRERMRRTFDSAWAAGLAAPRDPPPSTTRLSLGELPEGVPLYAPDSPEADALVAVEALPTVAPEPCTDLANAYRFQAHFGQDLRYLYERDQWLRWDGRRWVADWAEVRRWAYLMPERMRRAAEIAAARGKPIEGLAKHARGSSGRGKINDFVDLAKALRGIASNAADYDTDEWALNVANGILDLRTGQLRPHAREAMMTKLADVQHDPGADCPRWRAFLHTIFAGDEELIAFIQRSVGYWLSASNGAQVFWIMYGKGRNGKSTFIEVVRGIMGSYAHTADMDTFTGGHAVGAPRPDLIKLIGVRLASAVEQRDGIRLDTALIKQWTGGDRMSARTLHEKPIEFQPTAKIVFALNHRPIIGQLDEGIWRRLLMIDFGVQIPKEEVILDYHRVLLSEEGPAILAWALAGLAEYLRIGLCPPESVRAATESYREDEDILAEWITTHCTLGPKEKVEASALYVSYSAWAEQRGIKSPISQNAFGRRMAERPGIERIKIHGVKHYRGITLKLGDDGDNWGTIKKPIVPQGVSLYSKQNGGKGDNGDDFSDIWHRRA